MAKKKADEEAAAKEWSEKLENEGIILNSFLLISNKTILWLMLNVNCSIPGIINSLHNDFMVIIFSDKEKKAANKMDKEKLKKLQSKAR